MQTIKISKTRPDPQQTTISAGRARNENMEVKKYWMERCDEYKKKKKKKNRRTENNQILGRT